MPSSSPDAGSPVERRIDPRFDHRQRQPGLDLLRAAAIFVVATYHAGIFGFSLPGKIDRFGWIGVDLFFVLSGYLIAGQLLSPFQRGSRPAFGRFFARRALRIMPAYFAVLAIYFALPWLREYPVISPLGKFLLSVQNINLSGGTAFSHAWSLAIEDQFYFILPFLLVALQRRRRLAFALPVAIIVAGFCLRGVLAHFLPGDGAVSFRGYQKFIYYPTWTRLDPLVLGVALSAMEKFRPKWWSGLMNAAVWLWIPALALIAFALYLGEGKTLTVTACLWQFPLIAVGMAALLLCAVSPRLPLSRRPIAGTMFIASIAYSVYLSHKLVIHQVIGFCSRHAIDLTSWRAILLVQATVYLGGAILFFAVERPFLELRRRIRSEPDEVAAVSGSSWLTR